jgi:pimeloyl-ACP methyl ester carboxylesterase
VAYAESGSARIYYELHGGGPPLLLIPGFGATTHVYFAQIAALSDRFRIIAFDPRGAGRSDVPDDGFTMEAFADDCAAVLDAAGVGSAHVFGASFGGMVAQHLALRHAGRVERLALGCTTAGGTRHVLPAPERMATFLAAAEMADPVAAVRSTYPLHYSDAYAAERDGEITERALATAHLRSTPKGRAGQVAAVSGHDTYDRLPELRAPALVLHGDDDGVVPVANGKVLAERIPGARLKLYAGARHIFFVERATEVNRDLAEFFCGPRP